MNFRINVLYFIGFLLIGFSLVSTLGLDKVYFDKSQNNSALLDLGPAPQFKLIDSKGLEFSSASLKNKVWVANFIFSKCQGPCPIMSAHIANLANHFRDNQAVNFVSITIDPANDTPEVLNKYAASLNADLNSWHFLSGNLADINKILLEGFKLGFADSPMNHTTRFVLIDKQGMIRAYYHGTNAADINRLEANIESIL